MNFKDDWRLYDELKLKISAQYKKTPELFQYSQYNDLQVGILKEMMWSYKYIRNNNVSFSFQSKLKLILKNIFLLLKSSTKPHIKENSWIRQEALANSIGIYLDDLSLLNLFEKLIDNLKSEFKIFAFQFYADDKQLAEELETRGINYYSFQIQEKSLGLTFFQRLKLVFGSLASDSVFFNFLLLARSKVIEHIAYGERLFGIASPKCLLLNVAEQNSSGYVLSLIAHKNMCATVNAQNGWKGLDPINQDTNFDKWFIHDEYMKKVLLNSNVHANQLAVIGHPLEDAIKSYIYSGSLDAMIKGKKSIITLFSSFLYDVEQKKVADFLSGYCKQNSDTVVLVRLHPSDKKNKEFYQKSGFAVIDTVVSGNKHLFSDSLFDVLSVSSLTISFGSMVSFQSKWFHVPAISVEFQEESILNYIDNKSVWHVNDIQQMEQLFSEILNSKKAVKPQNEHFISVHQRMKEEIMSLIKK